MEATTIAAIEITGKVDEHHQLKLDKPLPTIGPTNVRVIVLYPIDNEWDETEWLQGATHNPAFNFLNDPEEDIYLPTDGKPFHDKV